MVQEGKDVGRVLRILEQNQTEVCPLSFYWRTKHMDRNQSEIVTFERRYTDRSGKSFQATFNLKIEGEELEAWLLHLANQTRASGRNTRSVQGGVLVVKIREEGK